jgi:chromosome partitioning protein
MTKILSIFSQKGGVGKTTVSVNLSAALSLILTHKNPEKPGRVLHVDLDEQAQSVSVLAKIGKENGEEKPNGNLADVLMWNSYTPVSMLIQQSSIPLHGGGNLDYLPSNRKMMARVNSVLENAGSDGLHRLSEVLEPIKHFYEFIVIDNPPSLNYLSLNSLITATHVLLPTQLETPAVDGLVNTIQTIRRIQNTHNSKLKLLGILPNMCDFRMSGHKRMYEIMKEHYKGLVLPPINRRSEVTYATTKGLDIFSFRPPRSKADLTSSSLASKDFGILANIVLKRMLE